MAGQSSAEPVDHRVARVGAVQHGVFTRRQAMELGAGRGLIDQRVASRRWELLYPGVYRLLGSPVSWRQSLLAACLAAGERTAASHRAAAALQRLPGGAEGLLELSVPKGRRVELRGMIVHQVRGFEPIDVSVVDAIPVTTPTRTLIDLATVISADTLEEALDEALRRRLTTVPRLRHRIAALGRRGRRGIAVLYALVEARAASRTVPESTLETRFLRLVRRAGLPPPVCQYNVRENGRVLARVDFAYPDILLAIEVDGYRWHSGRARWERDLGRRNDLTARGWRVIHVTSSDLEHRPDRIVRMIAEVLGGRKG